MLLFCIWTSRLLHAPTQRVVLQDRTSWIHIERARDELQYNQAFSENGTGRPDGRCRPDPVKPGNSWMSQNLPVLLMLHVPVMLPVPAIITKVALVRCSSRLSVL